MIGLKSIRIFPKAAVTTSNVGTAVNASFNSSNGAVTISSTSGVGTIDRDKLRSFWNTCGKTNIKTITFTNNVYAPQNCYELFRGLTNLTSINANYLNTSKVTNMVFMFYGCNGLTTLEGLRNWNVSNVTNMDMMFWDCTALTTLDPIRNWNVSNVTNMSGMFGYCNGGIYNNGLTTLEPIRNWNVSNVTNMREMFEACSGLTTLEPISNWNVSNVTDMGQMFDGCRGLTTLEPIRNWNVSNVTDMRIMFYGCDGLTTLEGLRNWNVSNVTGMGQMFDGCINIKKVDLSLWRMNNVTDVWCMFSDCESLYEIYTPAVLSSNLEITLYNNFIDADNPNDDTMYRDIDGSNPKFSKSVHLIRGIYIRFDLGLAEDYKLANYDSILKPKIYLDSEIEKLANTGGTEGYGTDLLPVTKDGKAILWDESKLENETGYKYTFIGWHSSYNNKILRVPYISSNFYKNVKYTACFTTNKIGSNVIASFDELTSEITIFSTSGIGTIDKNSLKVFCYACGIKNIKTITFTNEVNAPQDSSDLFSNLTNLKSINASYLNMSEVTNIKNIFKNCNSLEEIYTPAVLNKNISIELPSLGFRDADIFDDYNTYDFIIGTNPKFSESIHLIKGIIITFDLSIAEDYKLPEYDSILQNKIIFDSDLKNMSNTGGTEGKGEDILPITKDGKSILWDNDRLESETGYTFAGWESSYDNNIFQVPYVSSYFTVDTTYTAVFAGNETEYDLELTSIGEYTDKLLPNTKYRIEGSDRKTIEEREYKTDENGVLLIEDLDKDQEYTLTQLKSSLGYKVMSVPVKFKATTVDGIWRLEIISGGFSGKTIFRGSTLKAESENEIAFKVEKTDSETGEHLQGAKFTVKDSEGNYAKDINGNEIGTRENINGEEMPVITTNKNGMAVAEVNPGKYEVTEVQAPFGYELPENRTQSLEIKLVQEEKFGVEEVWGASYASNSSDVIERVVLTKDGGRIFVGTIGVSGLIQGGDGFVSANGDRLIAKYNKRGNRVWDINFKYSYPNQIVETKDEGLLVISDKGMVKYRKSGEGYEEEWSSSDGGRYIAETSDSGFVRVSQSGSYIYIYKYKKITNGYEKEWEDSISTGTEQFVTAIMETQDKGILLGGSVKGTLILPNGNSLTNSTSVENTFLIKYNKNLTGVGYIFNWGRRLTGGQNKITGITETTNGEYVVGGYLNGTVNLPNGEKLIGKGSLDNMVVKFDIEGNINLSFSIGGTGAELINQVASTNDGGFVTAGSMTSDVTLENGQQITPKGNRDALVVRYNKDGHVLWANTYGGSGMDYFTSVYVDDDNNVLLGTYFVSENITLYNGNVLSGISGNIDAAMIHLKEYVVEPEIIESEVALFEDTKHVYNITTQVEGEGGSISGADETPYEQVQYNGTSLKDIIVTPEKGYQISSITINGVETSFVRNDDGTVTMNKFTNMMEDKHIIVKFEIKPFDVIRNEISKTGTELITREGQEVSYDIQYSSEVEEYNGTAKVTIIDYLPYEIDEATSLLDGGTYDEPTKTITWEESIPESEAGYQGNKVIEINKHIDINYKNIDYTKPIFTNRVTSNLVIREKEYTDEDLHNTRISFTKTVEVTKKWDNTNNVYEIPNSIKIQLMNGSIVVDERDLTSINRVSDIQIPENEDVWKCEFTDLPIYDETGNEIIYTVNEVQTDDLRYYEVSYDQENMVVNNRYVGPVISQTKEVVTEYGKAYVVEGEKVTYKIRVKNDGKVAKEVVIQDGIPLGTSFVDSSIRVNGETNLGTQVELANGITVSVPANGETVLSFDVIVDELLEGVYFKQLKNTATVDGKDTNEVVTNVNKSNIVFEKTVTPSGNVTVGQELTYNIKVQNTGSLADNVRIEDTIPDNTTYVANSVKLGDKLYTDEELTVGNTESSLLSDLEQIGNTGSNTSLEGIDGLTAEMSTSDLQATNEGVIESEVGGVEDNTTIGEKKVTLTKIGDVVTKVLAENIELGENEEIVLSFKVRVNDNVENGIKIENAAIVNGKPTVPVENIVIKPIMSVDKEIKEIGHADVQKERLDYVFRGDTITYNIIARNTGDLGGYVTVKDVISDKVIFEAGSLKVNGDSNCIVDGVTVDLSTKTADDLANGIRVYVPERQGEKAGESILSFNVQVKETSIGDIENKAIWLEGEKIEENETTVVSVPIVVFEKSAEVIRNSSEEGFAKNVVTVNDEIKYTIRLENTGTADSDSFAITDVIPENTVVSELNVLNDGKIQGDKIVWNIDSLKSGETKEVGFMATVKYVDIDKCDIKNVAYVNEKPSNEVTTEYVKPVTKLVTNVTKDGDDTVLMGNGIKYKIEYSERLENFIGKVSIVIVDQLPFEIDDEKSTYGDGVYNKEAKTITWVIEQEDINTYTNGVVDNVITKDLLLYYKTDRREQVIENTVKATTQLIDVSEEVEEVQEKMDSHIVNVKQMTSLPETGGNGVELFIDVGLIFVGMAIAILANRKRFDR